MTPLARIVFMAEYTKPHGRQKLPNALGKQSNIVVIAQAPWHGRTSPLGHKGLPMTCPQVRLRIHTATHITNSYAELQTGSILVILRPSVESKL